jgi:TolB-like protein/Tfp pilus assembly protein PilF
MSGDSPLTGDALPSSGPLDAYRPPLSRDVFVSYASQDLAIANSVVEALETRGIRCWVAPRDVTPGEFYADAIVHAIDATQALVLVLSKDAAASHHILREVERASSKRHPVISLRIDRAQLPAGLEYFLNKSQWLDASEGEPSHVFPKLLEAVQRALARAPSTRSGNAGQALPPLESTSGPTGRSLRRPLAVVLSLVALAIVGFAISRWWVIKHSAEEKPVAAAVPAAPVSVSATLPEKSVAVLPFVDMSENKDQEYFSDGLAQELIDMLAKVPDLRVPARTSSFFFKGKPTTIADIAKALGVAHVLEGSVRKSGKTLRITAQLVRVDNGYQVWSETYDRKLDDIFKVQDEIANAVVKALKVSLLSGGAPKAVGTANIEAYTLYLQARSIWVRMSTSQDFERMVDYLQQAIKLDPSFAPAWAFLSIARSNQALQGYVPERQGWEEARRAAREAIALDPTLPVAHTSMAFVQIDHDWDWTGAQAQVGQALELEPSSWFGLLWGSRLADHLGQSDQALKLLQRAVVSDPLNSLGYIDLAWVSYETGAFGEATAALSKSLDLNPAQPGRGQPLNALVLLASDNPAAALAEFERSDSAGLQRYGKALAYHALGRKVEADAALAELETTYAQTYTYEIATVHAYRGEIGQAFLWLDQALRQRDAGLLSVKTDPLLKNIRSDPRYHAFLRKMKLPDS